MALAHSADRRAFFPLEARVAKCAIAFSVRRVRPARRRCFFPLLAPTRSKSPTAPSILAVIPFGTFAPAHAGPCSAASNRQRGVVHGSVVEVVVVGTRVVVERGSSWWS